MNEKQKKLVLILKITKSSILKVIPIYNKTEGFERILRE